MALTMGITPQRRGTPPAAGTFGAPVAPGETIWRGGLICWNASGQLQRLQTAGSVSFAGLASKDYMNTSAATAWVGMEALKGTFGLTVPSATYANINAPVYATDDGTLTLTASTNMQVGTLAGIENGQTYVKLLGS
ncbi:MAG TPA: hypothetical protein PLO69_11090 [Gammaproteobacteria bacterium]|nr:hypothetical protein [Gammaproteobacteria bacterium]